MQPSRYFRALAALSCDVFLGFFKDVSYGIRIFGIVFGHSTAVWQRSSNSGIIEYETYPENVLDIAGDIGLGNILVDLYLHYLFEFYHQLYLYHLNTIDIILSLLVEFVVSISEHPVLLKLIHASVPT